MRWRPESAPRFRDVAVDMASAVKAKYIELYPAISAVKVPEPPHLHQRERIPAVLAPL